MEIRRKDVWLLRPHHALCACNFRGEGYSKAFVENMTTALQELDAGRKVVLKASPDVICEACTTAPDSRSSLGKIIVPDSRNSREHAAVSGGRIYKICKDEEKVRRFDREVLQLIRLEEGACISWQELVRRVRTNIIESGKRREVCGDCAWDDICK